MSLVGILAALVLGSTAALGVALPPTSASLREHLAKQAVTCAEVVEEPPAGGARGAGQRPVMTREAVLQRVVGARIEQPLADLRLRLPAQPN
jgi:hypothetical protein